MSHGLVLLGEEACALQHNVHTQLAPGQLGRVRVLIDSDFLAVDNDVVLAGLHRVAVIAALRGVIFQQVREHLRAGEVVDCDDLIALGAEHLAEGQAADAAEAVDCNFYCHNLNILLIVRARPQPYAAARPSCLFIF